MQLPAGCHVSASVQGPVRPDAAAAKAAAAWKVLQQLQEPGHLAGYWGSAALLQQAGMEGGLEGGEAGSEAVLWRCEVCGVPATSARNLEVRLLHMPELCIMQSSFRQAGLPIPFIVIVIIIISIIIMILIIVVINTIIIIFVIVIIVIITLIITYLARPALHSLESIW